MKILQKLKFLEECQIRPHNFQQCNMPSIVTSSPFIHKFKLLLGNCEGQEKQNIWNPNVTSDGHYRKTRIRFGPIFRSFLLTCDTKIFPEDVISSDLIQKVCKKLGFTCDSKWWCPSMHEILNTRKSMFWRMTGRKFQIGLEIHSNSFSYMEYPITQSFLIFMQAKVGFIVKG